MRKRGVESIAEAKGADVHVRRLRQAIGEQHDSADVRHVHLAPIGRAAHVVEGDDDAVDAGLDQELAVEAVREALVVCGVVRSPTAW